MALVKLSELLGEAQAGGYAIGYFEAWDTYSMEAVIEAAQEDRAPVVIGFGGLTMNQDWLNRFGIKPLGAYGRVIAEQSSVPTAFILNEVKKLEHIQEGIGAGYNTVMMDSCHLPYQENVDVTRRVVELARPYDIEVQAELGRLPSFGEDAKGVLTDPDQAQQFVRETKIHFLAISIGNVHLQTEGKCSVDMDRLKAIRSKIDIPLVIHGGTGFPEENLKEVISNGVSLFHFGTLMKKVFLEATQQSLQMIAGGFIDYQSIVGSRKSNDLFIPAKMAIKENVRKYIRLYGASRKAR